MSSRLKLITQMYEQSLKDISQSPDNWLSFLKSATWNFGYNFSDKICIYAQRSDARACATIEEWNTKAKRWINPNSKGIALIKDYKGIVGLKYVFDVSDTHQYNNKKYNLWEVKDYQRAEVIKALENKFGILESKNSFFDSICSAACNAVEDNIQDYLSDLMEYTKNSKLEGLDEFSVEIKMRNLLNNSVTYMMLERCGINPSDYFSPEDFNNIKMFNTSATFTRLGNATSDIAELGIYEIKKTIKNLENNKNINHTFENKYIIRYSSNSERRDENGNNIYQARRLSNTKSNTKTKRQEYSIRQVRNNEIGILKGTQESTISNTIDGGQTNRTSTRNSRNGENTNRVLYSNNGETNEYSRELKETRPNEMGSRNEQLEINSRGNNSKRIDLQLEDAELTPINVNLLAENEQIENITNADVENTSAFIFSQETATENRNQYIIKDDNIGVGTPKEKYRKNITAITVLKKCEDENRLATEIEQEELANYVGWGGLPEVFDKNNSSWQKEYDELKNILTEEEYEQARASTLTAFYTPPIVIKNIYRAIENIGFKQGNILEPACGIGNFIGMMPKTLNNSKIYGIELDSITGRIAKQLYQKSTITIDGYENADLPDSFFDIAVGNVPFGDFKIADKRYDKNNFLIHDYFFR